jgi:hypothetical protein
MGALCEKGVQCPMRRVGRILVVRDLMERRLEQHTRSVNEIKKNVFVEENSLEEDLVVELEVYLEELVGMNDLILKKNLWKVGRSCLRGQRHNQRKDRR